MAFSTVLSAAIQGLGVEMIRVEADVSNGLPGFHMVGYLSSEVKEASERVRTAMKNSGFQIPVKKMVINLAPATVRKKGASFDLPIALSVLASLELIPGKKLEHVLVIGELSLDGKVREVPGVLPIVTEAKRQGCHTCIVPAKNAREGALIDDICILGAETLEDICRHITGHTEIKPMTGENWTSGMKARTDTVDFADICGQEMVKRAVEIAVAGGHNLLMVGPPGSGKSMIAKRIPTILPPLSLEESMEITQVYSVLGLIDEEYPLIAGRPFRSVHHTVTKAALIGGGSVPRPGEISLAHGGVLFLDELAEFKKPVLEVLRQPLEEREIKLVRTHGSYTFPANFILAAAMNPCPCGNYPDMGRCTCTSGEIQHYLGKISQPFLDRIDICIETPRIRYVDLNAKSPQESSGVIRERVCAARKIQEKRYQGTGILTNAMLEVKMLDEYCTLGTAEKELMEQAYSALGLTARTYHKILKVARTIADMDESSRIRQVHLKEAIGYRTLDKKYWRR